MTKDEMKAWRERLGLSQSQAAIELCTPKGTFQNWDQGKRRIPGYVEKLCQMIEEKRTR
jgi:DNA-binding transcriptional regulator YiaG